MNALYKISNASRQDVYLSLRRLQQAVQGRKFVDVCLVTAWAAMIPGLMWLGVAGGF